MKPMHTQEPYLVDLHLHSTYSDGLKSPSELCIQADRLGLTHVALSDHDTVDGLSDMAKAAKVVLEQRRARADQTPFTFLPCIEISSGDGGKVHILAYGIDVTNPELISCLTEAQTDRKERAGKILSLLSVQGIEIPDDLRSALIGPHIGRAHIARALVEVGVVNTMQQAFDRYLGEGRDAYVPRRWLSTLDALQIIKNAGGVAVLAHPRRLGLDDLALRAFVDELIAFGLDGMEVFHPSAGKSAVRDIQRYARSKDLLVTGGSDYHGDLNTRVKMGRLPTGWHMMREDVDALLSAMQRT
ncbi:MAG: PHP domain-containing protein [Clostridiales bacterium]|nr:PHP domain-containing protein [Clostridiales bacterium]